MDKMDNIVPLISDGNSDAGELLLRVKGTDNCKQILHNSWDKALPEKAFTKETVKNESRSLVPAATPYKKNVLAVLQK